MLIVLAKERQWFTISTLLESKWKEKETTKWLWEAKTLDLVAAGNIWFVLGNPWREKGAAVPGGDTGTAGGFSSLLGT